MNIKRIIIWFGIFGSVASIISLLYIFLPRENDIRLLVNTSSVENLTQAHDKSEPELKVEYKYKNELISNLWKYNVTFKNVSQKTLIGVSNQKNILLDHLLLKTRVGFEVLDYKLLINQFNHSALIDSNEFRISFEQWRPNELIAYSFYIKTLDSIPEKTIFQEPSFRQIVDGEIIFSVEQLDIEKERITQILPRKGIQIAYIICFVFLGMSIILITLIAFLMPISHYQASKWYKRYYPDFVSFVKNSFPEKTDVQRKFIENPSQLPSSLWKNFKGESFPQLTFDINYKKYFQTVLTTTLLILLDISLIILFIDLIYYFP